MGEIRFSLLAGSMLSTWVGVLLVFFTGVPYSEEPLAGTLEITAVWSAPVAMMYLGMFLWRYEANYRQK